MPKCGANGLWVSEPQEAQSGSCRGHGPAGHAIVHTVDALPLGLRAYASSGLREGPPNPCPRHPSIQLTHLMFLLQ